MVRIQPQLCWKTPLLATQNPGCVTKFGWFILVGRFHVLQALAKAACSSWRVSLHHLRGLGFWMFLGILWHRETVTYVACKCHDKIIKLVIYLSLVKVCIRISQRSMENHIFISNSHSSIYVYDSIILQKPLEQNHWMSIFFAECLLLWKRPFKMLIIQCTSAGLEDGIVHANQAPFKASLRLGRWNY